MSDCCCYCIMCLLQTHFLKDIHVQYTVELQYNECQETGKMGLHYISVVFHTFNYNRTEECHLLYWGLCYKGVCTEGGINLVMNNKTVYFVGAVDVKK